ncbi:UDP-N-acetylmuramate dehydrogenase [Patescibacteria group bacterium]|nr:UDP-N-acetylmuramate dehydrogenase [Patescibacteria group bacterium]MCL5010140.1 UDP-N-acetylmuramate dehydrogenase [Patescibacteria group bacterium]
MTVFEDLPLKDILYYKIGGRARFVAEIHNREDLQDALEFAVKNHITNILPLGLGSNILISDKDFRGLVLWFTKPDANLIKRKSEAIIESFSSNTLDQVINFAFENHLTGLEWAGGLPSTVGAAIRGNVGAFGGEIKDCVKEIEALELSDNGSFRNLRFTNYDLRFSYRSSLIKENKNLIITDVFFKLKKAHGKDLEEAKKVYEANINYRKNHHPTEYPSCGSVFKNITDFGQVRKMIETWPDIQSLVEKNWHGKVSMGYIIGRLGFPGRIIGGAQVSEKHSNYIVNLGSATFNDVYFIIQKIKEKFYATFGFYPQEEAEIIK